MSVYRLVLTMRANIPVELYNSRTRKWVDLAGRVETLDYLSENGIAARNVISWFVNDGRLLVSI